MLTLKILGQNGMTKAVDRGDKSVSLVYSAAYALGDVLCLEISEPAFLVLQMEDSIPSALGWVKGAFQFPVPFGDRKICYSPKSFSGNIHLLTARHATAWELESYRNLALNPLDCHENTSLYPHASANVETRGESAFAARNAINGNSENRTYRDSKRKSSSPQSSVPLLNTSRRELSEASTLSSPFTTVSLLYIAGMSWASIWQAIAAGKLELKQFLPQCLSVERFDRLIPNKPDEVRSLSLCRLDILACRP